jgi:hypothetical protein
MHGLPNKIGRVKNAPDYDSARCEIRVCAHAVLKCTDYPMKPVGLRIQVSPGKCILFFTHSVPEKYRFSLFVWARA